jgi:hypothetical protein
VLGGLFLVGCAVEATPPDELSTSSEEVELTCDADDDNYDRIGGSCGGDDCNDNNAEDHPEAVEWCGDYRDNDCDGWIDEPGCRPRNGTCIGCINW